MKYKIGDRVRIKPHINQWYRNPLLIIDHNKSYKIFGYEYTTSGSPRLILNDPDYPNGLLEEHTYLDVDGMREEKLNQILCNG